jgi:hypothetical protein
MAAGKVVTDIDLGSRKEFSRVLEVMDIDNLDRLLCVPIFSRSEPVGVIACANGSETDTAIGCAKFFSLIVCATFRFEQSKESRGRRQKILLHW